MRFIYLGVIVWVVLTVFTTVFAASANAREVRVLRKGVWILIIVGVPILGALLYLVQGRPLGKPAPTQLAPDDDPDFLRRLSEKFKKDNDKDDDKNA